jgi:hypothetical protein
MALLSRFVFFEFVELFSPLTSLIVLFSLNQKHSLIFLVLYP